MTVRIEIGIDTVDPERLAPFWADALGYAVGDMDRAGVYLDLLPPEPGLPVVYLQRVPERKSVKNRLHLDLLTPEATQTIGRLVQRGATTVGDPQTGSEGGWWQVMRDPEGNEFCVCRTD